MKKSVKGFLAASGFISLTILGLKVAGANGFYIENWNGDLNKQICLKENISLENCEEWHKTQQTQRENETL